MSNSVHTDANRRHDFVFLFDVINGNPNGDPDAGNLPRIDPETMRGLVTDVCIKRKIRNWVDMCRGEEGKFKIYIENRGYLIDHKKRAYEAVGAKKGDDKKLNEAQEWMCKNFYDVRTFGAVLVGKKGEGYNCGQVRGPVQLTFSRSIDPIVPLDISITRVALENPGEKQREDEDEKATTGTMGRKALIPYGLYVGQGFYNPCFAEKTGFDSEDLELFWDAMMKMWDLDRSSSRGLMSLRGLYIFSHENKLGNAPAHTLLDRVKASKKEGVDSPRSISDYTIEVDERDMPQGVTLTKLTE
ncbi:MAG: type I-C CRISPR-associated protein Cas7/Csd2 [Deltaproteobacteria bacterium]|nr:type I-C CRISPR-associated protein Cas7/Csd2 [Deltaproteobacteria bacterium]